MAGGCSAGVVDLEEGWVDMILKGSVSAQRVAGVVAAVSHEISLSPSVTCLCLTGVTE